MTRPATSPPPPPPPPPRPSLDRPAFVARCTSLGLAGTLLPGGLWAQAPQGTPLTAEMVQAAEHIAGLTLTPEQRKALTRPLGNQLEATAALRALKLDNSVPPALVFDPVPPGATLPRKTRRAMLRSRVPLMASPGSVEELAFLPVTALSELLRTRQ